VTPNASPDRRHRPTSSITAVALLAGLTLLAGCARIGHPRSGVTSTEFRQPGAFASVSVADSISVHIRIGSPASLSVTADDAVLPFVVTEVRGDGLVIAIDGSNVSADGVRVEIVVPTLTGLSAMSSAEAVIDGLSLDGFALEAGSSADVRASGSVANLRLRASSSADVDAGELAVRTAEVELASSAHATVKAADIVEGSVRESADLVVLGQPARVEVAESSSGHVVRR
jgi:hypothetical protein